jgi:hypothetical protein
MKKNYLFKLLFVLFTSTIFAQLPVSHNAENKNAVLEEFTGIHCTYCPDGHKIANQIHAQHPNDVVLINVHTGGYANPNPGEPDFRTTFGSALASQSGLTGYPSGTVNRHVFSGTSTAMGRGSWGGAVNQVLGQSSYCNIALEGTLNVQTRELTVNVEVYYTGNTSANSNYINVVLLQDNVEGPQIGASNFYPEMILPNGNYNHMHMLRHMLTGQWGEQITTLNQGTLVQKLYTYTIPNDINGVPVNLGDLQIAGFVAEGHQEIITGSTGIINFTNFTYTNNAGINNVSYKSEICSDQQFKASYKITNKGSQDITSYTITYNMNGGTNHTYTWNGNIAPLTSKIIDLPSFNFPIENTNTLNINLTSVNGVNDEDTTDNSITLNGIAKTTNFGQDNNLVVTITQDQWGSETTWSIIGDNGIAVANGGPYSDLGASGTLDHVHNVALPYGCYSMVVNDAYGDGMCCAYGAGSFKIETSNGDLVLQGSGSFSSKTEMPFKTSPYSLNVNDNNLTNNIDIYPNPNKGNFIITANEEYTFNITNMLGKIVVKNQTVFDTVNLDISKLSNGVYFANFTNGKNKISKKIIINK